MSIWGKGYLIMLAVLFVVSVGLMLFSNHPIEGFFLFVAVMFNLMFAGMCGEMLLTPENQKKFKEEQEREQRRKWGEE